VKKNSFLLLELEMADLERYFEKNTLWPLGVNGIYKRRRKRKKPQADLGRGQAGICLQQATWGTDPIM
jgi:hypothetical protein